MFPVGKDLYSARTHKDCLFAVGVFAHPILGADLSLMSETLCKSNLGGEKTKPAIRPLELGGIHTIRRPAGSPLLAAGTRSVGYAATFASAQFVGYSSPWVSPLLDVGFQSIRYPVRPESTH